jgi:hypothetical protein
MGSGHLRISCVSVQNPGRRGTLPQFSVGSVSRDSAGNGHGTRPHALRASDQLPDKRDPLASAQGDSESVGSG